MFTGYAEVLAATQDVEAFRANFRAPGVEVPPEEQFVNEIPEPRHGHVRKIINSAIASHRLTGVEPFCDKLCRDLLTALRARGGTVDLVTEYVMPVPNSIIAHLLGAEPEDYAKWASWSEEVVEGTYPSLYRNDRGVGFAGAHPEFAAYIDAIIADRRQNPREDFVTRLITREIDGRKLTDIEARIQLVFLFISGNETTRHLLGNLLHRLAGDPALFAELAADRKLVEAAIEESLRLDPPVRLLMRTCSAATVVAGEQISEGEADNLRRRAGQPRRDRIRRRRRVPARSTRPAAPPGFRRRPARLPRGAPGADGSAGGRERAAGHGERSGDRARFRLPERAGGVGEGPAVGSGPDRLALRRQRPIISADGRPATPPGGDRPRGHRRRVTPSR